MSRIHSRAIWNYFTKNNDQRIAKCNICDKELSYKTTITNIKSHLRRIHNNVYQEFLKDSEQAGEEEDLSANVWSYFEREPSGQGRCAVCRAVVPKGSLREHLRENHPKLITELSLISEEEASDSQDNIYTEIVYLEDEVKKTPKKRIKSETEPKKRQPSSSSDEELIITKPKRNKTEDHCQNEEIEQFAKYVTCLLKKVPREVCLELQMDIVNLIMKKQLELKRNETSELAGKIVETLRGEVVERNVMDKNNSNL